MSKDNGIFIPEGEIFSDLVIERTNEFLMTYFRGSDVNLGIKAIIELQTLPFIRNARDGSSLVHLSDTLPDELMQVPVPANLRLAYQQSKVIMSLMPNLPLSIETEFQELSWPEAVRQIALRSPRSQAEFDYRLAEMDSALRKILSGRIPPGSEITPEVIDKNIIPEDYALVRTVGFFNAGL